MSYDTYFDKTQNQSPETVAAAESGSSATWTSVLLNQTILENPDDFVASIVKMWIPRCYSTGTDYTTPCTLGYLMHLTLPRHDDEVSGLLLTELRWHISKTPNTTKKCCTLFKLLIQYV